MKWFEQRISRVAEYATKMGIMQAEEAVAFQDAGAPVTADTEKNNFDIDSVITTDAVDLSGEVVAPSGADWTYLDRVKSVFVDHDPSVASTVGVMRFRSRIMQAERLRGWRARMRLDRSKLLARECMGLAKLGVLHSSIGFVVMDKGKPSKEEKALYEPTGNTLRVVVRRWRAVEITLTAAPMNADCLANPVGFVEKSRANIEKWLTDGLVSKATALALGMEIDPSRVVCGFHGGYSWTRRR